MSEIITIINTKSNGRRRIQINVYERKYRNSTSINSIHHRQFKNHRVQVSQNQKSRRSKLHTEGKVELDQIEAAVSDSKR